jgi:phenylpyruvate tautomerase PptA (4-oxalocrotonate tautomerase family)
MQRLRMVRISRGFGRSMTEEEKQALMERITEGVQDFFDSYDWDKKFIEHFGE